MATIRWRAAKANHAVDRRSVVNPGQAHALLAKLRTTPRSGARLVAFSGCLYFAALRPEEVVNMRRSNLDLPAEGWGG